MKKTLLTILCSSLLTIITTAQDRLISFEANEGYTLGSVVGQNEWSKYGYLNNQLANVTNTDASVGERAVKVEADFDNEGDWGGLVYQLPNTSKFIISADIKFDGYGSDYDILSLYNQFGNDFEYVNGFYFFYDGETSFGDYNNAVSPFEWVPNTWYNLKSDVDFDQRTIKMYVNNSLVNTLEIAPEINSIHEVDFEFDNYETGYILDNFKFIDLVNLGVSDQNSKAFSFYPNPSQDFIYLENTKDVNKIEILDYTGKSIKSFNNSSKIDIRDLAKGIYLLKIESGSKSNVQKFIKN